MSASSKFDAVDDVLVQRFLQQPPMLGNDHGVTFFINCIMDRLYKVQLTPAMAIIGAVFGWMVIVRFFRWRLYNSVHRRYDSRVKNEKGKLTIDITPEEAQEIMKVSWGYDMPTLLHYALAFALFKTYGIVSVLFHVNVVFSITDTARWIQPSISKLLCETKELKSEQTIAKRYADVRCLLLSNFPVQEPAHDINIRPRCWYVRIFSIIILLIWLWSFFGTEMLNSDMDNMPNLRIPRSVIFEDEESRTQPKACRRSKSNDCVGESELSAFKVQDCTYEQTSLYASNPTSSAYRWHHRCISSL